MYASGDISMKILLPPRFDVSRLRIAFSGLLAFMFGFSWWFFSGFKKRSWKKIEILWSKIDFEIEIEKFSKIFENFEQIKIFENFWKISKNPKIFQFKSNYRNFRIFRFSKIFGKAWFFKKNSKIFRSRFQNRFSIKNFQYFFMIFFLNRYRIFWRIQKWRLEVPRT